MAKDFAIIASFTKITSLWKEDGMIRELHRKDFYWADRTKLVVTLTFDFQGGEHVKPDKNGVLNLEDYAIGEYGPNTGIWRILDMLDEEGVKATFLTCGAIAERYPEAAREIVARGHEIAGHGYHHEIARLLPKDEEREVIRKTHAMIEQTTERAIAGWRSCTQSVNTLDLLLDKGMLWNSNSFSHDMPFLWERDGKSLVELPRHTFGDGRGYGKSECNNPLNLVTIWQEAFDELYEEVNKGKVSYLPFQIHPYVSGRPGRVKALRTAIRHMNREAVSFEKCSDVANWVLHDLFAPQGAETKRQMALA